MERTVPAWKGVPKQPVLGRGNSTGNQCPWRRDPSAGTSASGFIAASKNVQRMQPMQSPGGLYSIVIEHFHTPLATFISESCKPVHASLLSLIVANI